MASGLPDRVECARLAEDGAVLERAYRLREFDRLPDLLADSSGSLRAQFAFASLEGGRAGSTVSVQATPRLVCQRCTQGFEYSVASEAKLNLRRPKGGNRGLAARDLLMDGGCVVARIGRGRIAISVTDRRGAARRAVVAPSPRPEPDEAVCRITGFVEENLIGQPMAVQKSRKTPSKHGMHRSTRRCRHRNPSTRRWRDAFAPPHYRQVYRGKRKCCRPRRMRRRKKDFSAANCRRPSTHTVSAAPYAIDASGDRGARFPCLRPLPRPGPMCASP